MLSMVEKNIREADTIEEQFDLVGFGSFIVDSYVLSLRGSEGAMINLSTIEKYLNTSPDWIMICLKGKIKGEEKERDHLFYCVNKTSCGNKVRRWTELLLLLHAKAGRKGGPAITDWNGAPLKSSEMDDRLHHFLGTLLEEGAKFPAKISSTEDIAERFSIYRSFRRASDTRALERKVLEADIYIVNRWKSVEKAKGPRPGRSTRQHYAEVSILKLPFLTYTNAM